MKRRYTLQRVEMTERVWFVRDTQNLNEVGVPSVIAKFATKREALAFVKTLRSL